MTTDAYEPTYFTGEWKVFVRRLRDDVMVYKFYKTPKSARAAFLRLDKDQNACSRFFYNKKSKVC